MTKVLKVYQKYIGNLIKEQFRTLIYTTIYYIYLRIGIWYKQKFCLKRCQVKFVDLQLTVNYSHIKFDKSFSKTFYRYSYYTQHTPFQSLIERF